MEKCLNCRYYDRRNARPGDGRAPVMWGQCRRHAPNLNPLDTGLKKTYQVEGIWPLVRDDDWCGEWHSRGRPPVASDRLVPPTGDVASEPTGSVSSPDAIEEPAELTRE